MNERACPRCGSRNVISADKDGVVQRVLVAGINDSRQWVCSDCGYAGSMVEKDGQISSEMKKDLKKLKKEIK